MPIRLSDLRNKTRSIPVEFQGESCNVTYRVNAVTPELVDSIFKLDTVREVLVAQVTELVEAWDVVDDDGQPVPPAELAAKMPIPFLQAVVNAINADMAMPAGEKKDSGAG